MHRIFRQVSFFSSSTGRSGSLRAAVLGTIVCALAAAPVEAGAVPRSLTLSTQHFAATAGDTLDLAIDLSSALGVSELSVIKFAVRVDTLALRPLSASRGSVLASWPQEDFHVVLDGDRLSISALTETSPVAITTGEFVRMRFAVRADAVDGWISPLDITATDDEQAIVMLADPGEAPPGIKTYDVDGSVVVNGGPSCEPGDASGNGVVGTEDAILTLRLAAGLIDSPAPVLLCGADANRDGLYNAFDASWILSTVVGLTPAKAVAAGQPALRLETRSDGLWLVLDAASGVRAAELELAASEDLHWLTPRGPAGALLASGDSGDRLHLALAAARSLGSSVEFRLPVEGQGDAVLVHARLYGGGGELLDFDVDEAAARWERAAGPPSRTLHLSGYPNPFNPSTTLEFDLPRSGRATLEIFDAAGRRVRVLLDEEVAAGTQRVEWHGLDASGRRVASGVYFARILSRGHQARQRLLLVK
jgi:hypothetical protein